MTHLQQMLKHIEAQTGQSANTILAVLTSYSDFHGKTIQDAVESQAKAMAPFLPIANDTQLKAAILHGLETGKELITQG